MRDSDEVEGKLCDGAISWVEYHSPSGTYRTEFDFVTRTASEAIVSAVADARDCDPLELPPLFHTIDTDALDSVVARQRGPRRQETVRVEFEYANYAVTVHSVGTVELERSEVE